MRTFTVKIGSPLALALLLAACGNNTTAVDMKPADADCVTNPSAAECPLGCLLDEDCQRKNPTSPRCEQNTHKCVACLPTNDNCPSGQVCQLVNNTYACLTTCTSGADCIKLGGGSSCCDGVCVPLSTDVQNCGACGRPCAPVNNGEPGCLEGQCIIAACNAGFDDCDKSPDDGCETPTGTDPLNCGGCGMGCQPFKNGIPSCSNGICAASCAPSYADCNARVEDGCEIDVTYDLNNCGACGKTCTAPANATASCDQGTCSFRCKLGFADCDGNRNNGCEASVNGDASNCGHCGNVCPTRLNAQGPACSNGLCGNTCNPNFGDCDGNPFNGCESNNLTDLNNCGGCRMGCLANHAKATCAQGACTLVCDAGFTDCNMDGKDGCEANFQSDPNNCGGCGNVCPQNLPGCSKGVCVVGYFPVGPQVNLPVAQLAGWTECYRDQYNNSATAVATILQKCSGSKLLLGCSPNNAPTLNLAAYGDRVDVTFDTGQGAQSFHDGNGTSWYFNASYSWGFFFPGDGVSRNSCDTQSGAHPEFRMCWHTGGGNINSGYRCGNTFLNGAANWDRIIYQIN